MGGAREITNLPLDSLVDQEDPTLMSGTAFDDAYHYPPELLDLLIHTIPSLCRSKRAVLDFFRARRWSCPSPFSIRGRQSSEVPSKT